MGKRLLPYIVSFEGRHKPVRCSPGLLRFARCRRFGVDAGLQIWKAS